MSGDLGMKLMIKTLFKQCSAVVLIVQLVLFFDCKADSSLKSLLNDMTDVVNKLDGRDDEITKLIYETRIALNNLEKDVQAHGADLQHKAMVQMMAIKQKLGQELKQLQLNTDAMGLSMQDAIKQESIQLSNRVGQKTLDIIDNVEQLIFAKNKNKSLVETQQVPAVTNTIKPAPSVSYIQSELRSAPVNDIPTKVSLLPEEVRQDVAPVSVVYPQAVAQELVPIFMDQTKPFNAVPEPKLPVTSEWKNNIAREFYKNVTFLRDIVVEGESEQEVKDFAQRFNQQSYWFDNTLRTTQYVYDQSYTSIMQKCSRLNDIVSVQKRAEMFLMQQIKPLGVSKRETQKMRLTLLYNLYSLLPDGVSSISQSFLPVGLTEQRLREEVHKILYSLQPAQGMLAQDSRVQILQTQPEMQPLIASNKMLSYDSVDQSLAQQQDVAQPEGADLGLMDEQPLLTAKSPLQEVRDILLENRSRERQAQEYLKQALQGQELERLQLELKLKEADNSMQEIRIAQQALSGELMEPVKPKDQLRITTDLTMTPVASVDKKTCTLGEESDADEVASKYAKSLIKINQELKIALERIQQELVAKHKLQLDIEHLDKKNVELEMLLKQSEDLADHAKKQSMILVRKKMQEVRDELTELMSLKLRATSLDVAEHAQRVKQQQVDIESHVKKNLVLETEILAQNQKVTSLNQQVNLLEKERAVLQGSLQVVKQQVDELKKDVATHKQLSTEAVAKSVLVQDEAKKSIDSTLQHLAQERAALAKERENIAKIIERQKLAIEEEKQALLNLKNKLLDKPTTLSTQQGEQAKSGA